MATKPLIGGKETYQYGNRELRRCNEMLEDVRRVLTGSESSQSIQEFHKMTLRRVNNKNQDRMGSKAFNQ